MCYIFLKKHGIQGYIKYDIPVYYIKCKIHKYANTEILKDPYHINLMLCMFVQCTHHFWFSREHGRSDRVSPWRGWQCQLRLWPPSAGRWSYLFWSPLSLQYACLSFLPPLVIVFFSSLASFSSEILVFLIFFHIQLSNFSFNLTVPVVSDHRLIVYSSSNASTLWCGCFPFKLILKLVAFK